MDVENPGIVVVLCVIGVIILMFSQPKQAREGVWYGELFQGMANVLQALEKIFGKKPNVINPLSYCPLATAVLRVRRYSLTSSLPSLKWWVDVCYLQQKADLYVVGTIESTWNGGNVSPKSQKVTKSFNRGFQVVFPVPSKIVAYFSKHRAHDVKLPIAPSDCLSPAPMFAQHDPFGKGPFVPVVPLEDDDNDDDSSDDSSD